MALTDNPEDLPEQDPGIPQERQPSNQRDLALRPRANSERTFDLTLGRRVTHSTRELTPHPSEPASGSPPRGARQRLLPGAKGFVGQTTDVASSFWSEPTRTSMRRGLACSATGMATVRTPAS